jgi:hypothetical protein
MSFPQKVAKYLLQLEGRGHRLVSGHAASMERTCFEHTFTLEDIHYSTVASTTNLHNLRCNRQECKEQAPQDTHHLFKTLK